MCDKVDENHNPGTADGVQGHVMRLVTAHALGEGVHLDLGCAVGASAERVRELGLTYIGLNSASVRPYDVTDHDRESGSINLRDVPAALSTIRTILDGRPVAAATLLDRLEDLTSRADLLSALRDLVADTGAPLIVVVPNVARRDIAINLLTGRFDHMANDVPDDTRGIHHAERLLCACMAAAGWYEVARDDVLLEQRDQAFPDDQAGLDGCSSLSIFLLALARQAAPDTLTNQFIRAYTAASETPSPVALQPEGDVHSCFLTVVVRTQGLRSETLRDAFLCLQGQTDRDFEVVVAIHNSGSATAEVVGVIEELPQWLRSQTRVIAVEGGGRARPLNLAFDTARGRYVAVLDDDDLVLAHWVETFASLAMRSPGSVLRTLSVEQAIEPAAWEDRNGIRTVGGMQAVYPREFVLFDHLSRNLTPFMAWAFPRSAFRDLGLRFDESLDICEDWDFELRAALLVGVEAGSVVTSVYRRWQAGTASHTLHAPEKWRETEAFIVAKMDAQPHIFPPGTITQIRESLGTPLGWTLHRDADVADLLALVERLEQEVRDYKASRSWRLTRPLRALTKRPPPSAPD